VQHPRELSRTIAATRAQTASSPETGAARGGNHWDIGCLYNPETEEHPQLYFSHEFKVGNPSKVAAEVRKGLNQMKVSSARALLF
jgi:hypothetical protein